MQAPATSRQVPFFIGRYRCEEYLGGGMADVYRARDSDLPRDVAIKILKPEACNDPEARKAFLDEAQLASRCSHENIVAVYDKGEYENSPFLVMEFLRGTTLDQLVKGNALGDQRQILNLACQISLAIEYVHGQNIIHRDLKPQNLHLDPSGRLKLLDFGIAKATEATRTQAGIAKGTAHYMAPEQVMGEAVSFQTDFWAFGVLLYEMLAGGRRPFQGGTLDALWAAIANGVPDYQPLADAHVPERVLNLIRRCLEKEAHQRPTSWDQVRADLMGGGGAPQSLQPWQQQLAKWQTQAALGASLSFDLEW